MNLEAQMVLDELKTKLRYSSIAQIGGFRPPDDLETSWFGKGVCLENEGLPVWNGKKMFPLLQINVTELPFVPKELSETKLLVIFFNQDDLPFDKPNGEGWLIREYKSLKGLVPLPEIDLSHTLRSFPIKWNLVEDDAPGWETAWEIVDLKSVNEDEEATNYFFKEFNRYICTKVGGFPDEVQHYAGLETFVFQIGSEEKANWNWIDSGTAYFYKNFKNEWSWGCQFL